MTAALRWQDMPTRPHLTAPAPDPLVIDGQTGLFAVITEPGLRAVQVTCQIQWAE